MSAQFFPYSPVENGGNKGGRPLSYQPPAPRFYAPPAPPKISTPPQSDSLQPTPPTSYRHSHSFSTTYAGGPGYGHPPVNMRERSSSHSLAPTPYYPGRTSAPSSPRLSPSSGAHLGAPNGQTPQTRSRSGSFSPLPMALQPGSGPSSRPHSPPFSSAYPGAPNGQAPQTRERSSSYSPHPMQLQPGSRPSSRPHSPSLSFTGGDELHFGDISHSSSRQPSPPSSSQGSLPPALQATQQLSLHPQGVDHGPPASRERSPSSSFRGYAPYVAPQPQPQQFPPQPQQTPPQTAAPALMYPQDAPAPLFNGGYPTGPLPSINQPPAIMN
ncbi:hypothetical protein P170DRAFT_286362 [Aspergillus steynii IBT 23096]|uniref:Uncharacterized protein n=1 Tax=Aspergillus steynii IBT 23096 TaxID=1392250 RepID=A0A2I2FUW4_9EURO|nr:uncharacterized protein P170DRAFT_286362 [Aspergillus steynii IBT 23096]PLB44430.1 hypothetical protein P170DRAFT_286362 [Aspergillus steynii IBT 23096]